MQKKYTIVSIVIIAALLLASCQNAGGKPTAIPEETFKTYVAGTITAVADQVLQTQAALPTNTATAVPTSTPEPTLTPTKEIVKVSFSQNTNCRRGASTTQAVEASFPAGAEAVVLGRNKANDYYYVQNPNDPNDGCWVWGQLVTLNGDLETLPVFTPQPTPLPTFTPTPLPIPYFTAVYSGLTACGAGWAANFTITNTGKLKEESIRIKNTIAGDPTVYTHASNYFTQWSGGAEFMKQGDLTAGELAIVSTCNPGNFTSDPTGKKITAEITICTLEDLKGVCTTQTYEYSPH